MGKRLLAGALLLMTLPMASANETIKAEVMVVKREPIEIYASYPGTVVPSEYIQVASRMSGYVQNIKVHEGETVKKGELLLTVNPTEAAARVQQAQAQVAKARAALETAEENYKRFKALYEERAIPKQRFEQIELAHNAAKNDYAAAKAALQQAQSQMRYSEVRAPFTGVIFSKNISNGQLVSPGQELMILYNSGQLQVEVEVDDLAYYQLKLGEHVPVQYAGPDQKPLRIQGTVQHLVAASNPVTHTHTVKLLLPADSKAQGGEYARVMIPVQKQPAIVVPETAIRVRAGITGVFVVNKDHEAQFRMVTLGQQRDHKVVVLSGLADGDRLILSAQGPLANGVKIEAIDGNAA